MSLLPRMRLVLPPNSSTTYLALGSIPRSLSQKLASRQSLRRKTMTNNLCATFRMEREQAVALMEKAGLDLKARGETLTLEQLAALADAYTAMKEENA